MALASWLQDFANQYGENQMNRTANVSMESDNKGAYTVPAGSQFTELDYSVNPKLENVETNPNIKDWEQSNMESDTSKTQSRVDQLINTRKNMAEKDGSNIDMNYNLPKASHVVSDRGGRKAFSRVELAKLARAASGDVLDSIEEILDDAERFVQASVPVGQREAVLRNVMKALAKSGIQTRFTVLAKEEAPQAGYDHYTMSEVSNFIQDDYRSVPKNWNMSQPEGHDSVPMTSVNRAAVNTPTVQSVRRAALAKSLMGLQTDLKKALATNKNSKTILAKYNKLVKLAFDESAEPAAPDNEGMPFEAEGEGGEFDPEEYNDSDDDEFTEEPGGEADDHAAEMAEISAGLRDGSMTPDEAADKLDGLAGDEDMEDGEDSLTDESGEFGSEEDEEVEGSGDEMMEEQPQSEAFSSVSRMNRFVRR